MHRHPTSRPTRRRFAFLTAGLLLAACSSGGPVFESITFEVVPCGEGITGECLEIEAPVIGSVGSDEVGSGTCILYASGVGENLFEADRIEDVAMIPGETFLWLVNVAVPQDPTFKGWNPFCSPTAEG